MIWIDPADHRRHEIMSFGKPDPVFHICSQCGERIETTDTHLCRS